MSTAGAVLLDAPSQAAGRKVGQTATVRQAQVVREHYGRVHHRVVHQTQRAQVVLQTVADEHRVGADETHQITLNGAQGLSRAVQLTGRDAREARVVVDHGTLGAHQGVIHTLAIEADHRDARQLQALAGVAHLTVERVHAVVAVGGRHAAAPGADEPLERAVQAGQEAAPDVTGGGGAASAARTAAAAGVARHGAGAAGLQLAPVEHTALGAIVVVAIRGDGELLRAADAVRTQQRRPLLALAAAIRATRLDALRLANVVGRLLIGLAAGRGGRRVVTALGTVRTAVAIG